MNFVSYCIFSTSNNSNKRVGARINNVIIDLHLMYQQGVLDKDCANLFDSPTLNQFIDSGNQLRHEVKTKLFQLVDPHGCVITKNQAIAKTVLALDQVKLHMPLAVGGFTDFYVSKNHATNVGSLFRPDNPLMPNWDKMPIGYNGRASSIRIDHPVIRPRGQILVDGVPELDYSKKLDFEVELGVIIGKNSTLGKPIAIENAHEYIFGICILNDWSARDIQQWEYQPLGPFNSKGFLTSISPFIIPIEELEQFKVSLPPQLPKPLPYLMDKELYNYDIHLDITLKTNKLPQGVKISSTNFTNAYWSMHQWIAQHTIAGCNLRVGDILASGTLSGTTPDSYGCLLEMTRNGANPLQLPNGETRTFLEDGDEVIISGYCKNNSEQFDLGYVGGKVQH